MMGGIIIQLVSICVFVVLILWVISNARATSRTGKMHLLLATTSISVACIIIRNFYRVVELSQCWREYLIRHEVYFDVLDGVLMVLAGAVFNLVHPVWFLHMVPVDGGVNGKVSEEKTPDLSRGG